MNYSFDFNAANGRSSVEPDNNTDLAAAAGSSSSVHQIPPITFPARASKPSLRGLPSFKRSSSALNGKTEPAQRSASPQLPPPPPAERTLTLEEQIFGTEDDLLMDDDEDEVDWPEASVQAPNHAVAAVEATPPVAAPSFSGVQQQQQPRPSSAQPSTFPPFPLPCSTPATPVGPNHGTDFDSGAPQCNRAFIQAPSSTMSTTDSPRPRTPQIGDSFPSRNAFKKAFFLFGQSEGWKPVLLKSLSVAKARRRGLPSWALYGCKSCQDQGKCTFKCQVTEQGSDGLWIIDKMFGTHPCPVIGLTEPAVEVNSSTATPGRKRQRTANTIKELEDTDAEGETDSNMDHNADSTRDSDMSGDTSDSDEAGLQKQPNAKTSRCIVTFRPRPNSNSTASSSSPTVDIADAEDFVLALNEANPGLGSSAAAKVLVASGVTGTDRLKGISPVEIEAYITELFQGQAAVGVFAYDIFLLKKLVSRMCTAY